MANLRQNADTALEGPSLAGSDYNTEALVQNQVSYAPMGGLSLRLRGSTRILLLGSIRINFLKSFVPWRGKYLLYSMTLKKE